MSTDQRQAISSALAAFTARPLREAAVELLATLGYRSDKTLALDGSPEAFLAQFDRRDRPFRRDKALIERWKSIDFLFQLTDDEIRSAGHQATLDFDSGYDATNFQSYLFFALDLEKAHYTRTQLSAMTREINRLFDMPAMLIIRHNDAITAAVIDRRISKRDERRDVLEKVKLIKDIRCDNPHRAHVEILHDLALPVLIDKHACRDFNQLHQAWRKTLDSNELNKKFYRELANWYFWALDHVKFPDDTEKNEATRNATNVIRLLTRLIFCWFLKEKGLIPAELFAEKTARKVLKYFTIAPPENQQSKIENHNSNYYLAILQNLFFGTLNQRMNTGGQVNRQFAVDGASYRENVNQYGVKNLYRYQKLFAVSEDEAVNLFEDVPFLNGGLFDCLDKEDEDGRVVYVDGFTRNPRKQPAVPNFLFFSDYQPVDLSGAYGDTKRRQENVRGLIHLLESYKFTVTENTPIEEEIALDPELLGKVFENLLASYNPETGTTARKQTGSFYTPREIVDYMVDESLIASLTGAFEPRMDANGRELRAAVTTDDTDSTDNEKGTTKHAKGTKEHTCELAAISGSPPENRLRALFAYTEQDHAFGDREVDALIEAIDACKILDPACGSGAFPMGILHKLVFILGKLDPNNERWKQKQLEKAEQIPDVSAREIAINAIEKDFETNDLDYGRKLYLIENCIYGVDIQPIAIQISKLRFFISLVCDQRTNRNKAQNCGVRPLPNLETKFVAANTLIALDSGPSQGLLFDQRLPTLEKQLAAVRHKHFAAQRRRDKLALQKRDRELREEIAAVLADGGMSSAASRQLADWDPYDQNASAGFFDPEWMYGVGAGFDVVIGNPPYVQIQKFPAEQKAQWQTQGFTTYAATADIYCLFYERGVQLLKPGGHLCYITSNKWMRAGYGSGLREFFATKVDTHKFIDFGGVLVFNAATVDCCTLLLERAQPRNRLAGCVLGANFKGLENLRDYFDRNMVPLITESKNTWVVVTPERFRIKQVVEAQGIPLEQWDLRINYGIKTGLNEAFYLTQEQRDDLIAREPQAEKIIVPLLRGRYVERYATRWDGTWRMFIPWHFPLHLDPSISGPSSDAEAAFERQYPVSFADLLSFKSALSKRNKAETGIRYEWYALQRWAANYHEDFQKPKIIYPNMTKYLPFYCDEQEHFFINDKAFIMTSEAGTLPYLIAIFNSTLFRCCFIDDFVNLGEDRRELRKVFFDKIPIRPPQPGEVGMLAKLVGLVQTAKKVEQASSLPNRKQDACATSDARFLEHLIDACVLEMHFPKEAAGKGLTFLLDAGKMLESMSARSTPPKIPPFVAAARERFGDIPARLTTASPELFGVILKEGEV